MKEHMEYITGAVADKYNHYGATFNEKRFIHDYALNVLLGSIY